MTLAHELCHHFRHGIPSAHVDAVVLTGGDDGGSLLQGCLNSLQNGFLPIVPVCTTEIVE